MCSDFGRKLCFPQFKAGLSPSILISFSFILLPVPFQHLHMMKLAALKSNQTEVGSEVKWVRNEKKC